MKFVVVTIALLVFQIGVVCAQTGFKVKVRSDNMQALPYSYLYVNGIPVAVSDSAGVGYIPLKKLALGSVISASCIATSTQQIVYDEELQKAGAHTFVLNEVYSSIDAGAVVVKSKINAEKMFNKYVKFYHVTPMRYAKADLRGDFESRIQMADSCGGAHRHAKGRMSVGNGYNGQVDDMLYPSAVRGLKYYKHPVRIATTSDTTMISTHICNPSIHYSLDIINNWIEWMKPPEIRLQCQTKYSFLGKRDGCRIFRLSLLSGDGYSTQVVIFADENSCEIRRVELAGVSIPTTNIPDSGFFPDKLEIGADCQVFVGPGSRTRTTFITDLELHMEYSRHTIAVDDLTLSGMTLFIPDRKSDR